MSFFFDVWMRDGFILASDVRLMVNDEPLYAHKIAQSHINSGSPCAIVACGEYPKTCITFFLQAVAVAGSLRDAAKRFATLWTKRYGGTEDYSAVHLVGFEYIPDSTQVVPQMWYWNNWAKGKFISMDRLDIELQSYSDPVPWNNHIPSKIKELFGLSIPTDLQSEKKVVMDFLEQNQPYFTWNGDIGFWSSATDAVGSAMKLLRRYGTISTIDQAANTTIICLEFLTKLGTLLPHSTVGSSPSGELDVLIIKPNGIEKLKWASLSD